MFAVLPKSNKSAKEKTQRRLKFKSGFGSTISQKYMFQHCFSNFCLPKCAFDWIFLAPTGVLYIMLHHSWSMRQLFSFLCVPFLYSRLMLHHIVFSYILLQYFLTTYSIFSIFVLYCGSFYCRSGAPSRGSHWCHFSRRFTWDQTRLLTAKERERTKEEKSKEKPQAKRHKLSLLFTPLDFITR